MGSARHFRVKLGPHVPTRDIHLTAQPPEALNCAVLALSVLHQARGGQERTGKMVAGAAREVALRSREQAALGPWDPSLYEDGATAI